MSSGKLRPIRYPALFAGLLLALCEAGSPSAAVAGVNAWTPVGPEGGNMCATAVAPSEPARVYAVVAGVYGGSAEAAGLFRSADGGSTWEPTGAAVGPFSCLLSVDTADPLRLYSIASPEFGAARTAVRPGSSPPPGDLSRRAIRLQARKWMRAFSCTQTVATYFAVGTAVTRGRRSGRLPPSHCSLWRFTLPWRGGSLPSRAATASS